jgi:hypothetical protein
MVRSRNHSCRGGAIRIAYSACVSVTSVIQHALRMRRVTVSSVACPALQYFYTLSLKRHGFRKPLLNVQGFFFIFLQLLSETCHSKKN